jgi:hypothetical protein
VSPLLLLIAGLLLELRVFLTGLDERLNKTRTDSVLDCSFFVAKFCSPDRLDDGSHLLA